MNIIKGADFGFYLDIGNGNEVLCHATDFTMAISTTEIEVSGPGSGAFSQFIPGVHNATLSVPGVVDFTSTLNIVQLQEIQLSRQIINWIAGLSPDGGLQYTGSMFITSTNVTSQTRDAMRFDMTARVTGELEIVKNPIIKTVFLANLQSIRLPGCPNPYPVGVLWYDGTFIGPANNADEVKAVFNAYAITQGGFLEVLSYTTGCDFTVAVAWNSPLNPDVIFALTAPGFALRGTMPNEAIGGQDGTNEVISA